MPQKTRHLAFQGTCVLFIPAFFLAAQSAQAQPAAVDPGWQFDRTIIFDAPQAAHYNPVDGYIYVARRIGLFSDPTDGLYRIEADGTATLIASADRPAALVVNPADGAILVSEDFGGRIYRTPPGGFGRDIWTSGFHPGDDDPVGLASFSSDYTGQLLMPGEALLVDRGANGPNEIWRISFDTREGETRLHRDNGTLVDPVDITVGASGIFVADAAAGINGFGEIFEFSEAFELLPLATASPMVPTGIASMHGSGDLLVVDASADRVVRVNAATGDVYDMFDGFSFTSADNAWAAVDVSDDGTHIVVTDRAVNALHEFSAIPVADVPPPPPDGDGDSDDSGSAHDGGDDSDDSSDSGHHSDSDDDGFDDILDAAAAADMAIAIQTELKHADLELFQAKSKKAQKKHKRKLTRLARKAVKEIKHKKWEKAARKLDRLYHRLDGLKRPKDWLKPSDLQQDLADRLDLLIDTLESF